MCVAPTSGGNSYIAKPFDFEGFFEAMRSLDWFWLEWNVPPPPPQLRGGHRGLVRPKSACRANSPFGTLRSPLPNLNYVASVTLTNAR